MKLTGAAVIVVSVAALAVLWVVYTQVNTVSSQAQDAIANANAQVSQISGQAQETASALNPKSWLPSWLGGTSS